MREILFRGKRVDNGEWVYGDLLQFQDHTVIHYDDNGRRCAADVYPSTVGQFTGLTDKNGKKIFEGDIISVEFEEDSPECGMPPKWCENYIVAFDEVHHCWSTKISDMEDGEWLYEYDDGCATVIGNVHDNPELLKEAK